jgi:tight adherence protein C
VITTLLLAAAGMAFAAARRAAAHDRMMNPPAARTGAGGSARLLAALGRRPAALVDQRAGWPRHPSLPVPDGAEAALAGLDPAAFRAGSAIAFACLAVVSLWLLGGVAGVASAAVTAGFGVVAPDLWLRAAAGRRSERIERRVPELVELVASLVASGMGVDAALRGAGEAVGGELGGELDRVHANLALGRPRTEELRDLAARTGSPSLAQLALTLRLSDRLGVPLADALRRQADRARAQRARAVQERAARAGPRVLVVVVFVLVPAALLPLAAAVLLTVSGTFSGL